MTLAWSSLGCIEQLKKNEMEYEQHLILGSMTSALLRSIRDTRSSTRASRSKDVSQNGKLSKPSSRSRKFRYKFVNLGRRPMRKIIRITVRNRMLPEITHISKEKLATSEIFFYFTQIPLENRRKENKFGCPRTQNLRLRR